ncbi:hypothetical protein DPX16_12693 [Anabarilius grahami]|uniref:Uncharacterized protein n=1 Tax=Anabarilius grahami TaxID=495550 RepID=A0A3N0XU55_ANAGA|nr:hypothetical protein DPX16_12693 [Anabarilius grahami]
MKAWFVLFLLLPLCMDISKELDNSDSIPKTQIHNEGLVRSVPVAASLHGSDNKLNKLKVHLSVCGAADYNIECYGEDFLMVRNMVLYCKSKVPQACYTRATGEKGCVSVEFCKRKGWKCCNENRCNA